MIEFWPEECANSIKQLTTLKQNADFHFIEKLWAVRKVSEKNNLICLRWQCSRYFKFNSSLLFMLIKASKWNYSVSQHSFRKKFEKRKQQLRWWRRRNKSENKWMTTTESAQDSCVRFWRYIWPSSFVTIIKYLSSCNPRI